MKTIRCNIHLESFDIKAANDLSKDSLKLSGEYTFKYDYPLSNNAAFKHKLTNKMTAANILLTAKNDYARIYNEEDTATKVKPGLIPGMLNRNETDGPYGIWGHSIGDLFFEGIKINEKKKEITFDIGS